MTRLVRSALFILGAIGLGSGAVAEDDGFRPLFNGSHIAERFRGAWSTSRPFAF